MSGKPWFVIRRKRGGFNASPASGAGWLALLGVILIPLALSLLLVPPALAYHPALGIVVLIAVIGGSLFGFFRIVVHKGRWID